MLVSEQGMDRHEALSAHFRLRGGREGHPTDEGTLPRDDRPAEQRQLIGYPEASISWEKPSRSNASPHVSIAGRILDGRGAGACHRELPEP